MNYEIGADGKYVDLPLTNLPAAVDEWEDYADVDAANIALVNQYKTLMAAGNKTGADALAQTNPQLKRMLINAAAFNELRQAQMALERMWVNDLETYVKDQVFADELMVGQYIHAYNSSTKTHNFTGKGFNGRVKITAEYHNGDKFAINGTVTSAYMGGTALTNLFNGQYMYFIVDNHDGNKMYFIGGGDTSDLMSKSGGMFSGQVKFGSDNYYVSNGGAARLSSVTTTGTITSGGAITASGNITGAKVYGAVYNDYAEWFERGEETEPGDIIALDTESETERYIKADSDHNCVVGVHSDEYFQIIGGKEYGADKDYFAENMKEFIPVGLAGRVKTKVIGHIHKGDCIVPSDLPGVGRAYNATYDDPTSIVGRVVSVEGGICLRFARVALK